MSVKPKFSENIFRSFRSFPLKLSSMKYNPSAQESDGSAQETIVWHVDNLHVIEVFKTVLSAKQFEETFYYYD